MTPAHPRMPDFLAPTAGFAHTIDSAMLALERLGIPDSRITVLVDGPGRPSLALVRQSPPAGAALTPGTRISLAIAGFGCFHALPVPMRESGGEREMGTREMCSLLDGPIEKAARWFRAGSPLFAFSPARPDACRRWLALFGIDSLRWPDELLFPLSLLMPALARLAGRASGVKLTLQLLFGLPLHAIEHFTVHRTTKQHSLLGQQRSRLGVDWIAGDRMQDLDGVQLRIGPTSLERYTFFQAESGMALIENACALCLSAYQEYRIAWLVEDTARPPVLGHEAMNSRLGVNFHLGRAATS